MAVGPERDDRDRHVAPDRRPGLSPDDKFRVWCEVVAGDRSRREIARRWGISRSTVAQIVKRARQGALDRLAASSPGRPRRTPAQVALQEARAEVERLRAEVAEQAVELRLHRGKAAQGLPAGPVPARVDGDVKAGMLGLIDSAVRAGWSQRRVCRVVGLTEARATRWRRRRAAGRPLDDARPGPRTAPHGLLERERAEIVALAAEWGDIDRSHRMLAHRGSRADRVHVSASTVHRVLRAEQIVPRTGQSRAPVAMIGPWPQAERLRPNQVWAHDAVDFARAGRRVLAMFDVVSRKWLRSLVLGRARRDPAAVAVLYSLALRDERLWPATGRLVGSDHGAYPPTPSTAGGGVDHRPRVGGQCIGGVFDHVVDQWPSLWSIRDPADLTAQLERVRVEYNTVRLHPGTGYVTPEDAHEGRAAALHAARRAGMRAARTARIARHRNRPAVVAEAALMP